MGKKNTMENYQTTLFQAYSCNVRTKLLGRVHTGSILFGDNVTFADLLDLLNQGGKIRSTTMTKSFDFKSYQVTHESNAIPLFAIDPKQRIHLFTSTNTPNISEDWSVISLISDESQS